MAGSTYSRESRGIIVEACGAGNSPTRGYYGEGEYVPGSPAQTCRGVDVSFLRYALAFLGLLVLGFAADFVFVTLFSQSMGIWDVITVVGCAIVILLWMRPVLDKQARR